MSNRITHSMMQRNVLADLNAVSDRLSRTQSKIASNREISKPSDDPFDAVVCDVSSGQDVERLAQAVGDRLDVLVNNAGGALGLAPTASTSVSDWRAMFESNVIGTLQVTQALLPALIASGAGTVINVGSIAGRVTRMIGPYAAISDASP